MAPKNYIAELEKVHQEYQEKIAEISEERRVLVTSERTYQYGCSLWTGTRIYLRDETDGQGTPSQITSLVKFIKDKKVPALFLEPPRPMETVSKGLRSLEALLR